MVAYQFGQYEGIVHQVDEGSLCVDVVKGVSRLETLVLWVVHYCRGEGVETGEVCQNSLRALN